MSSPTRRLALGLLGLAGTIAAAQNAQAFYFTPGDLVVSTSTYQGTASSVTVGQTLPGGGTAVANGSYPNVFQNEGPDSSFGITSSIVLQELTTSGTHVASLNIDPSVAVTSFPSKSELSLNLSTNGQQLSFSGYAAPVNALDVSNSNTPGHVDPTNPVAASYQRVVVVVGADGSSVGSNDNAYSGNNQRAVIVNGSNFYAVGNAGNGSGTEPVNIVSNTGVQIGTLGNPNTSVVGVQNGTPGASKGFQFGFSVTSTGAVADKSGKDDNFRGETIFNNTLYVTKGSGGNGVDTVYQVGTAGTLPTLATASSTKITILPGLPTGLASAIVTDPTKPGFALTDFHPFGIWFANATTLYVADEGDGVNTMANALNPNAGLEKWTLSGGTWHLAYTLQKGLDLGIQYNVCGSVTDSGYGCYSAATDGLRNLTGQLNADGTVDLYAITSTISTNTDQGADPNRLVAITDTLADTTAAQAAGESFTTLETAAYGQVLRGVSFTPTPEPASFAIFGAGLAALGLIRRKRG